MNERYLFRGKRLSDGEWLVGDLCHLPEHTIIEPPHKAINGEKVSLFEVDPSTIGQCTGLYDKNGKLIFEGDILLVECKGIRDICSIAWEHGGWRIFGDYFDDCPLCDLMRVETEVIGTIHDTPRPDKC